METALFAMIPTGLIICVVFCFKTFKAAMGSRCGKCDNPYLFGVITVLGLGLAIASLFLNSQLYRNAYNDAIQLHRDRYNDAVFKGYTVYVDGQEADANGVAIDNYSMEIDDELQVVRLTERSQNGHTLIFIPIIH